MTRDTRNTPSEDFSSDRTLNHGEQDKGEERLKRAGRGKGGFSKILIGILALLIGVIAGAAGFYLINLTPRSNIEAELAAKTARIDTLEGKLDSLAFLIQNAKEISPRYEEMLKQMMDTDTLNKAIALGTSVGGRWQLHSADDVVFLDSNLVFAHIDDGHVPAVVLLRILNPARTKTWKMLWGEYE